MKSNFVFLSHSLAANTPSYGDKEKFDSVLQSNISNGDSSNQTKITMSVHLGTHIDFPKHFFLDGQNCEDFDASFFVFQKPLFLRVEPQGGVICDELICNLDAIDDDGYDILLVETLSWKFRNEEKYWSSNYGFAPQVADFLRKKFPAIRVFGFDSISVSSFTNRAIGREAHRSFLDPKSPILLLEDMDFSTLNGGVLKSVTVAPLRIGGADGAPCTVIGEVVD